MYLLCTTYTRNTSLFVLSKFSNRVGKYSMREKLGSFKCSEKISRVQTFIGFFLFLYNKRKLDLVFFFFFFNRMSRLSLPLVSLPSFSFSFLALFYCTLFYYSFCSIVKRYCTEFFTKERFTIPDIKKEWGIKW